MSGPELGQRGSLLELSWGGREPLVVEGIGEVTFLEDGDLITIRGWANAADGGRLGLGEVSGTITAASH